MCSIQYDILPVFCDIFQLHFAYEREAAVIRWQLRLVTWEYKIADHTKKRVDYFDCKRHNAASL